MAHQKKALITGITGQDGSCLAEKAPGKGDGHYCQEIPAEVAGGR